MTRHRPAPPAADRRGLVAEWESLQETLQILADADEMADIRRGLESDLRGEVFGAADVEAAMEKRRNLRGR